MSFFSPPLFLLPSLAIPLYHSYCEVVCLNPARPLWACRLFFSQWPSTAIDSFNTSLVGSCVPFVFPWASRTRLLPLGFLGPFHNFASPWAFTKFVWVSSAQLNYSLSLGFMGLPLTPYFLCFHYFGPAVAHSHFSISYIAHGLLFLSFRAPLSPFTSSRPICLSHGPVIHYFCHLGLMSFFYPFANSFLSVLLSFSPPLELPKWPSTRRIFTIIINKSY